MLKKTLLIVTLFLVASLIFVKLTAKADSFIGFNEGHGSTVSDSEGTASGTITNAVWRTESECVTSNCLYFDGSGDYVSFGDDANFDFTASTNFTIEFWFRTKDITSGTRVMVAKYNSSTGTDGGYKVYMSSDGKVNFGVDDDSTWGPDDIVTSTLAYDDSQWHHVVATKTGTTNLTLYIDALRVNQDVSISATGTLANTDALYVGIDGDGSSNSFVGFVDELKIFTTTARTETQVKTDFQKNSSLTGTSSRFGPDTSGLSNGLVGYWKMDEGSGNLADSSGNLFTLSNTGSTVFAAGKFGNGADLESTSSQYFKYSTAGGSISFIQGASSNLEFGVSSQSVTFSSTPTDNDIIYLLYTETDGTMATRNWPSGFTQLSTDNAYFALAWKRASSEASATYTLNLTGTDNNQQLLGAVYRGAFTSGDPNETVGTIGNTYSSPISVPSITTLTDTAKHIIFITALDNMGTPAATSYTLDTDGNPYARTAILSKTITSAGSTGSVSVSSVCSISTNYYNSVSLKPEPSNIPDLNLTGSLTAAAWIKPESNTASTLYNIVGKWDTGEEGYMLSQYGDEIRLYINSTGTYTTTNAANLATGTWYHVSGVYDAQSGQIRIYINGTEAPSTTTGTIPTAITHTGGSLVIGSAHTSTTADGFYDGVIDDTRIYNRALSSTEINQLYNWAPSPIAWWKFDESSGSTAYDTTLNSHDLTQTSSTPVQRTGTVTTISNNANSGSQAITAPSDATGIVVMTGGWDASHTNMFANGSVTWNGISLGSARNQFDTTASSNAGAVWAAQITDIGSQTFAWNWEGTDTVDEGGGIFVFFIKNVDWASPIVATGQDGTGSSATALTTGSMSGSTGNLTLSVTARYSTDAITWTGATKIGSSLDYNFDRLEIAETSPTGSHTVTISSHDYHVLVSIVLKNSSSSGSLPGRTLGKFNSSSEYNGSNTSYQLAYSNDFNFGTGGFTVSGWFNANSGGSGTQYLISRYDTDQGFKIWLDLSGYFNFGIDDDATWTPDDTATSSVNYRDNTWHYFAAVKTSSAIYAYIDGMLVGSDVSLTATGTLTSDSAAFTLGSDAPAPGSYFYGKLDELKVYNYSRSALQVVEDMNAGHPTPGSPVGSALGYWNFDEGYGDTIHDKGTGGNNGTKNANVSWSNTAKFGKSVLFNGTGVDTAASHVDLPNNAYDTLTQGTISIWFKPNDTGDVLQELFSVTDGSNTFDNALEINYLRNTDSIQIWQFFSSTTQLQSETVVPGSQTDWHHVVVTIDSTGNKVYIDGQIKSSTYTFGTGATSSFFNSVSTGTTHYTLACGYDDGGCLESELFEGYIDEVKIYSSALNADQVKAEYNHGASQVLGSLSTTSAGVPDNSSSREFCVPGDTSTCTPPSIHYPIDEGTGTATIYDRSGNAVNGTMSGFTSTDWVAGKTGSALSFDGVDNYITADNVADALASSSFTISLWFKTSYSGAGAPEIIAFNTSACNNRLLLYVNSGGSLSTNNSLGTFTGAHTVNNGTWHHLVVEFDDPNNVIYVAVDAEVDISFSHTESITATDLFSIGQEYDGAGPCTTSNFFDGQIDEVRIYNYIRQTPQIIWDYNRGAPKIRYKMDECTGSTLYNTAFTATGSGTFYNGTISAGNTSGSNDSVGTCGSGVSTEMWNNGTTGKFNSALDFDGTNDSVDLGDLTFLEGINQATWSFWAKPATLGTSRSFIGKGVLTPSLNFAWSISSANVTDTRITVAIPTTTSDAGTYGTTDAGSLAADTWIHIVAVFDGTKSLNVNRLKIYLNGINVNVTYTGTIPTALLATSNNASMGTLSDGLLAYDGIIDDLQIFNYALTPTQVKSLYSGGAAARF
jgi:hypothetical protein